MLIEFLDLEAWAQWFAALDRQFVFLLALPFVVAMIGLWSWWAEKGEEDEKYEQAAPQAADEPRPPQRERRARARRRDDVRAAHST